MKPILLLLLLAGSLAGGSVSPAKEEVFLKAGGLSISKEGYQLILNHEVGGGANYYNRALKRPVVPGGASGVTIGIGYDLGYNTKAQIAKDWHMLSPSVLSRLQSCSGVKGSAAKRKLASVRSITIPWEFAQEVYRTSSIPRFAKLTIKAYPGIETLHPHMQSTRLSWTFNRGSGISSTSSRDKEKRALRRDTPANPKNFPSHYRSSKRLWVNKGLDGLLRRREDEARLDEKALKEEGK
jgi:hypothetical protein